MTQRPASPREAATPSEASQPPPHATPPRILIVDHVAAASGGQLAMARLVSALGGSVEPVFAFAEQGPVARTMMDAGHEVLFFRLGSARTRTIAEIRPWRDAVGQGPTLLTAVTDLARIIRAYDIDVVYTNSQKAHVVGGLASRLTRRPWILHLRDILAPPYVPRKLSRAFEFFVSAVRPSLVIANSSSSAAAVRLRMPVFVIPSGITREPRREERVPSDAWPKLALMGRLVPWKGQDVAIRAMPAIRASLPHAELHIAGDAAHGDRGYMQELQRLVSRLGLEGVVHFTGFVDDPFAFFAACDLSLLTSVSPEPFGQVVVESLAVGRPVVASNAGGPVEVLSGRRGGVLIRAGDSALLAATVTALARDRESLESLSDAAVERAADYSVASSATTTLSLINSLVGPRRAHAGDGACAPHAPCGPTVSRVTKTDRT